MVAGLEAAKNDRASRPGGSLKCRRAWQQPASLAPFSDPCGQGILRDYPCGFAEFIAHMRQDSKPQPLAIEIVNAREIGATEKVLTIRRDDSGKMSSAAVVPVS